jgi:hypothetical protein
VPAPVSATGVAAGAQPTLKAEIFVRPPTDDELRIRDLNKRATELKSTDIHGAIACIREAHEIARRIGATGHAIEFWLRLPLFLQRAGQMEAAESEFKQIEEEIKAGGYGGAKVPFLRILNRKRDLARERHSRAEEKSKLTRKTTTTNFQVKKSRKPQPMNSRASSLFYQWCEFHCGLPMAQLVPKPVSGMQMIEALWPLGEYFRQDHAAFKALQYDSAFEAQADQAIEHFLNAGAWGLVSVETRRVLLERYHQALVVAAANEAAANPVMSIPTALPAAALSGAAMIWMLHSMKLPFPAADRSLDPPPTESQ